MKCFVVLALVVMLPGLALADDARRLRVEAGALVQAADIANTARKRKNLLEKARSKLLEIRERHPSASARLTLYLAGERVTLTLEDLETRIAAAPLADLDVGKLREVLGRSLSPTAMDENGWTDLHWAAALNRPELAKALIDLGADVGAALGDDAKPLSDRLRRSLKELGLDLKFSRKGYQPSHIAAFADAKEVAALLIERGADINAKGKNGWTPLHGAAWSNASKTAALLIGRGADINANRKGGQTPLHVAARENASETAALLIGRGADVSAKRKGGQTPLHDAAWNNASGTAALLIEHGADIDAEDKYGSTPLHVAARKNASETAALLVERGADIRAKDAKGRTPLAVAIERNAQSVSALLKKRQKDIEDRLATMEVGKLREVLGRSPSPTAVDENGWTDLHWAAALNLPELAKALIDLGADVGAELDDNAKPLSDSLKQSMKELGLDLKFSRKGYRPSHIAAFADAREVLTALFAAGAAVEAKAKGNGWTNLHAAAYANSREAAAILIERRADIHAKNKDGATPLHAAALGNAKDVAGVLIELGADIHVKNKFGNTPMHYAAAKNAKDVAAVLIERGANIHAKNAKDRTPLAVAIERNAQAVSALLKERQKDIEDRLATMDIGKLREVLGRSPSPTAVDENGWTDLHWAAVMDLPDLAEALLDADADVEARLKDDNKPLSKSLRQAFEKLGLDAILLL